MNVMFRKKIFPESKMAVNERFFSYKHHKMAVTEFLFRKIQTWYEKDIESVKLMVFKSHLIIIEHKNVT